LKCIVDYEQCRRGYARVNLDFSVYREVQKSLHRD
jgi:hypothetical protein